MLLRTGEVLQQVAELVGLDDPQIDLQAGVATQSDSRRARGVSRLDQLELRGGACECRRITGGGDDVEVLDAVGHPPRRSRQFDTLRRGMVAQLFDQLLAHRQRPVEHHALLGLAGAGHVQGREDALLRLRSEAFERADPMLLRSRP